jgi:hypothetical protein
VERKLATGNPFDDDHRAAANRTAHLGRDLSLSFAVVCTQQSPALCEHTATPAVGKKAEVADADQTLRQNVDQESAQKLICGDGITIIDAPQRRQLQREGLSECRLCVLTSCSVEPPEVSRCRPKTRREVRKRLARKHEVTDADEASMNEDCIRVNCTHVRTENCQSSSVLVGPRAFTNLPNERHAGSTDCLRFSFLGGKRKKSRKLRSPACPTSGPHITSKCANKMLRNRLIKHSAICRPQGI